MNKVLARLREPSTYAALAAVAMFFSEDAGTLINAAAEPFMQIVGGALALFAIINRDPGSEE